MSVSGTLRRTARYLSTQFARLRGVRRVRLYCVGTAKSGTHSIAAMFGGSVRARHEADNRRDIREILEVAAGRVDRDRMKRYVRRRDRRLYLDIDSSQVNFFMLDALLTEFPGARFLLTIRDPYSWLDSIINDSLRRPSNRSWTDFRNFCFRSDIFSHPPEELALAEHGLYTLDGYLSYWAAHNQKVLSDVPEDRLLTVRTDRITDRVHEIAEFAGLPPAVIELEKSHAFRNPRKFGLLFQVDRDHLEKRVRHHCRPLMERFFPEVRSMEDSSVRQ